MELLLDQLALAIVEAVGVVAAAIDTVWAQVTVQGMLAAAGGVAGGGLSLLAALVMLCAVLVAGARLALEGRGERLTDLLRGLAAVAVASGATVPAVGAAGRMTDLISVEILGRGAPEGAVGAALVDLLLTDAEAEAGAFLVVATGMIAVLLGGVQVVLLYARVVLVVVLAVGVPVLAAWSPASVGARLRLVRGIGWMVAALAYSPAAALAYAVGLRLAGDPGVNPTVTAGGLEGALLAIAVMTSGTVVAGLVARAAEPLARTAAAGSGR